MFLIPSANSMVDIFCMVSALDIIAPSAARAIAYPRAKTFLYPLFLHHRGELLSLYFLIISANSFFALES